MKKIVLIFMIMWMYSVGFSQSQLPGKCSEDCANQKMLRMDQLLVKTDTQYISIRFIAFSGAPEQLDSLIEVNLEILNTAVNHSIIFSQDSSIIKSEEEFILTGLHEKYRNTDPIFDEIINYSKKGGINVFLMPTIEDTLKGQVLLGFTPLFQDWFEGFEQVSPRMDNIFVSYDGLLKGSTLTHEMGHFLGLAHPFQLDYEEKKTLGLATEKAICTNFMNYNCFVNQFTEEQVIFLSNFAKKYRGYLTKEK